MVITPGVAEGQEAKAFLKNAWLNLCFYYYSNKNQSYIPRNPLHDTSTSIALLLYLEAYLLSRYKILICNKCTFIHRLFVSTIYIFITAYKMKRADNSEIQQNQPWLYSFTISLRTTSKYSLNFL